MARRDFPQQGIRSEGEFLHKVGSALFPLNRSLTGDGVRTTLSILASYLPGLRMHEVPSGTTALDWTVPDEWNVREAYLVDPEGRRFADFANCNVHLMSYSEPGSHTLTLSELDQHLHVDPELPDAVPYVTSYYHRSWGFCLSLRERSRLADGTYHAVIDATLEPGHMTYADLVVEGDSDAEVLISTYICHPSLANNELSGPLVALGLARWLMSLPRRKYTYRFVFAPETIGAITYIDRNLEALRRRVVAAINLTCIGDDGDFSYLASRLGNTPMDRIARRKVKERRDARIYSYIDRGSDERHYGMPGVDIPMISLMRTKYGAYREYHTHLDDLTVVTPTGLQGGFDFVRDCIDELETSRYFLSRVKGEPQLGKRGLYHTQHARTVADQVLVRTHILAYSDGKHSLQDMSALFGVSESDLEPLVVELLNHGLIEECALHNEGTS